MATAKRRAQGRDVGGHQKRKKELPKVSTGIAGLDLVLRGGLPAGRVTLLGGGPGSGKSMMGLQCLVQGAAAGTPGILIMFEERAAVLVDRLLARGRIDAMTDLANAFPLEVFPDAVGLTKDGRENIATQVIRELQFDARLLGQRMQEVMGPIEQLAKIHFRGFRLRRVVQVQHIVHGGG